MIENKIQGTAATEGCKAVDLQVRTTLSKLLVNLPTQFKIDDKLGVAYTIQALNINDYGIKAQLATNGTFTPAGTTSTTVKP